MFRPAIFVLAFLTVATMYVLWPKNQILQSNTANLNGSSELSNKTEGNSAAVRASLKSRLKAGETISSPEIGEMVETRQINFYQPTLSGRTFSVSGTIANHFDMHNFSVMFTNWSTPDGLGNNEFPSINSDGSFSVNIDLVFGTGLYVVDFQAPITNDPDPLDDDFSYRPAASWVVRVE